MLFSFTGSKVVPEFLAKLYTVVSSLQSKSQMDLLGTGSLSLSRCFVKSMLVLAVIITEQLNGLGNQTIRGSEEFLKNIYLRFDLD